jgi:hypothetical protein
MTAINAKSEVRTILNFSGKKYSKNHIKQSLRKCEIIGVERGERINDYILYLNKIKIGMYTVLLQLPFDSSTNWTRLKDYGDFEIKIYDTDDTNVGAINLKKDARFRHQYWVSKNIFGQLRIKHLIDIIAYCSRLDQLRAFL